MNGELESRIKILTGINELMLSCNNEDAIEPWFMCGVPGRADENEIAEMAADKKTFEYCLSLFLDLVRHKYVWDDGIYIGGKVITATSRLEEAP